MIDRRSVGWRVAAVVMAVSMLAVACSSDSSDDAQPGDTTATSVDGGGGAVDREGTLKVAYDLVSLAKGGFTWDPTQVSTQLTDSAMFYLVYGTMLRKTVDGELVNDLAESTTIVDPTTIEVKLRPDQTFSDGQAFDAEAVKAGLERQLTTSNRSGPATAFYDLTTVTVVDPLTVRLGIPNGTAASWHDTFLPSWETSIVPADFDPANPAGAGPYAVTQYSPETSITLERRDDYWEPDAIQIKTMEVVNTGTDPGAATTALAAGQVEFANLISVSNVPAVGEGNDVVFQPNPDTLMTLMTCKTDGPLANADVRRAVNMAIDRDAINDAVFQGSYIPATGLWPDGHRFHDPSVDESIAYDPEAAKQLLADAGYPDGFTTDIYVIQSGSMPEVTQIMQQQLDEIGVTVNLVPAPSYVADFLQARKPGFGAVPTMSPGRLKLLQWTGESVGNTCGYDDDELNALQTELNGVSDSSDEAVEIWHRIERKAVAEDSLSIFLLFGASIIGYDTSTVGDPTAFPTTIIMPDPRATFVRAG